jgi:hypothetical protein
MSHPDVSFSGQNISFTDHFNRPVAGTSKPATRGGLFISGFLMLARGFSISSCLLALVRWSKRLGGGLMVSPSRRVRRVCQAQRQMHMIRMHEACVPVTVL